MRPDSDVFRKVMGHFVTGVTVVTTLEGERPRGITVNALSSVSLDPPLVMVALDRRRYITPIVRSAGRFAVNVLAEGQQATSAEQLANTLREAQRLVSDLLGEGDVEPGSLRRPEAASIAGPPARSGAETERG